MSKSCGGNSCAEGILIVGNYSTQDARQLMKLEADNIMTIRQRIEVSQILDSSSTITIKLHSLPTKVFSETTMSQKLGPSGPLLHSCKVDLKLI